MRGSRLVADYVCLVRRGLSDKGAQPSGWMVELFLRGHVMSYAMVKKIMHPAFESS